LYWSLSLGLQHAEIWGTLIWGSPSALNPVACLDLLAEVVEIDLFDFVLGNLGYGDVVVNHQIRQSVTINQDNFLLGVYCSEFERIASEA